MENKCGNSVSEKIQDFLQTFKGKDGSYVYASFLTKIAHREQVCSVFDTCICNEIRSEKHILELVVYR